MTSENRNVCETLNFYKVNTTNFNFDLEKDIDVALQRLQKGQNTYLFGPDAEERAAAEAEYEAETKYGPVTFPGDCTLTEVQQLDIKTIVRAMRHHFLFSTLDEETLMQCALSLPKMQYESHTHVLDAGNVNDTMFFVLDGTATVTIPQNITVQSAVNTTEETQSSHEVEEQKGEEKEQTADVMNESEEHNEGVQDEAHDAHINNVDEAENDVKEVVAEQVTAGDNDNKDNIDHETEAATAAAEEEQSQEKPQEEAVQFSCTIERHDTFGELNILHDCFSTIRVVADSPLRCACLTREAYQSLTSPITKERVEKYTQFLRASHAFEQCSQEECVKIASALRAESHVAGNKIIQCGLPINWVYVVVDGTLNVCGSDCFSNTDEQGQEQSQYCVQTRIAPGELAGQLQVLFGHVAVADVVIASKSATLYKLTGYQFNALINDTVKDAMRTQAVEHNTFGYYQSVKLSSMAPAQYNALSFDCPVAHIQ